MKSITIKLDPVAESSLTHLMSMNGWTQSDAVRESLSLVWDITKMREYVAKPAVRKKQKRQATEFDKRLVASYQTTFRSTRRVFWPAVLTTIRAAQEKGVTDEELMGIVEVAQLDPWVQIQVKNGDTPALQQLLTEAMIGRLLPLLSHHERQVEVDRQLRLDGTLKPKAFNDIRESCDVDMQSAAYDLIQQAKTEEEVHAIISAALDHQLGKYIKNMGAQSE